MIPLQLNLNKAELTYKTFQSFNTLIIHCVSCKLCSNLPRNLQTVGRKPLQYLSQRGITKGLNLEKVTKHGM
jgi:hypothetical protein